MNGLNLWVFFLFILLSGCSGMSEQMTTGFVKGLRSVPEYDFSSEEKGKVLKAKERFSRLFDAELKKRLEDYELSELKGWMVLLRFYSDGTTKTASLSLYTYWAEEERHEVYSVPIESFVDERQMGAIVQKAAQEVAHYLLHKGPNRFKQMAD